MQKVDFAGKIKESRTGERAGISVSCFSPPQQAFWVPMVGQALDLTAALDFFV